MQTETKNPTGYRGAQRWRLASVVLAGTLTMVAGLSIGNRPAANAAAGPVAGAPPSRLIQVGNVIVNVDHIRTAIMNPETSKSEASLVIDMYNDERITISPKNVGQAWADLTRYVQTHPVVPH
jgi:hypothetical protein